MSRSPTASHAPSSAGRRIRFGAMSVVLIAAATVSLVIANLLAARYPVRMDVTEMREHRLSPRSQALVSGLTGSYEVVVAAPLKDRRLIDPRAVERTTDVLDQFQLAAGKGHFKSTWIDTGSASGMKAYDDLLKRLVDRDAAGAAGGGGPPASSPSRFARAGAGESSNARITAATAPG